MGGYKTLARIYVMASTVILDVNVMSNFKLGVYGDQTGLEKNLAIANNRREYLILCGVVH